MKPVRKKRAVVIAIAFGVAALLNSPRLAAQTAQVEVLPDSTTGPFSDDPSAARRLLGLGAPRSPRAMEDSVRSFGLAAAVTALILFLTSRAVKQPLQVSVSPLGGPLGLCLTVSEYIRVSTEALERLGFSPRLDFTVPELPMKGFYRFLTTADGAHTALIVEIRAKAKQFVGYVEYQTLLGNGARINTNNSPTKSPLLPPPDLFASQHPRMGNLEALFAIHKEECDRVKGETGGSVRPQKPEEFPKDFEDEWTRNMEYQIAKQLMKKGADGRTVSGTVLLVLRSLAPSLADREALSRALGATAIGAVLVALTAWWSPQIPAFLGRWPSDPLVKQAEAAVISLWVVGVGYAAGSGGYLLGVAAYLPTFILFTGGSLGHLLPVILSANAGLLGDKLRNRPKEGGLPLTRYLSPELYLTLGFLFLAGC